MFHKVTLMKGEKIDDSTNYAEQTHDPMINIKDIVHYSIKMFGAREVSQGE